MLNNRLVLATLLLLAGSQISQAADMPKLICPGTSKIVASDPLLREAMKAAYPDTRERRAETRRPPIPPCLYPYQAVAYGGTVLLITLAQEPGKDCHGCPARLSAVVLNREGRALKPVGRHENFTEIGTFGNIVSLGPFQLGSKQGIVIEGGGTFQGYTTTVLVFYVIENGRMRQVGPENGISSGDSNCGALMDEGPCRDVTGEWQIKEGRLQISYSGVREDQSRIDGSVTYELRGDDLVLVSGAELAAEMEESRP